MAPASTTRTSPTRTPGDAAGARLALERRDGARVVARRRAVPDRDAGERRGAELGLVAGRDVHGVGRAREEVRSGSRREEMRLRDDARRNRRPARGPRARRSSPARGTRSGPGPTSADRLCRRVEICTDWRGSPTPKSSATREASPVFSPERVREAGVRARRSPAAAGSQRARYVERRARERGRARGAEAGRRRHRRMERAARRACPGPTARSVAAGVATGAVVEGGEDRGHVAQDVARHDGARAPGVERSVRRLGQDARRPLEVEPHERERALGPGRRWKRRATRGPESRHDGKNRVETFGRVAEDERPVGVALDETHEHRAAGRHAADDERRAGDGTPLRAHDAGERRHDARGARGDAATRGAPGSVAATRPASKAADERSRSRHGTPRFRRIFRPFSAPRQRR